MTTIKATIRGAKHWTLLAALNRRENVKTGGSFEGQQVTSGGYVFPGWLDSDEIAALKADQGKITYAVYSYATPIYWETSEGKSHRVAQKFSVTTSKHQGVLYALEQPHGQFDDMARMEGTKFAA